MAEKMKVEAGGITVEIDPRRLADVRVQVDMGRIVSAQKGEMSVEDEIDVLGVYAHMLDVMFDDADGIMDALANKNDGVLTESVWTEFFNGVMASQQAKNS